LWPQGFSGMFDWISALITLLATVALFYFKLNLLHVIAVCGILGLVIKSIAG